MDSTIIRDQADLDESAVRDRLTQADKALKGAAPYMQFRVFGENQPFLSDEVVARVRGMLLDVANQFTAQLRGSANMTSFDEALTDTLTNSLAVRLASVPAILEHAYAASCEWLVTMRMQARSNVDPVVSPLLQCMIADRGIATSQSAMQFLSAQTKYAQDQRRMKLPVAEMSAALLPLLYGVWRDVAEQYGVHYEEIVQAERAVEARTAGAMSRTNTISRFLTDVGNSRAFSALEAGVALFVSAIATATKQHRDSVVMAMNEESPVRFALMLRAAGLSTNGIEEQFLAIRAETGQLSGVEMLPQDRAAHILSHVTKDRYQ